MAYRPLNPATLDPAAPDPCATWCAVRAITCPETITPADLAVLAVHATVAAVPAGDIFITEGEPAVAFFVLTAGTAKLFKALPDGRVQITGFVGPGQFLGLAATEVYTFSAEAIEPVRHCHYRRDKLRALLAGFPLMEERLLEVASSELEAAQAHMLLLGRKTARERLASFLLAQSRQGLPCGRARTSFRLPISHHDVADYLGLSGETVSRTFTRLASERLLSLEPVGTITILDAEKLEELAEGD